jgi:acyl-[acyl-carrier-protein]-phospholipid O-acyltransferase/long-chain-fatty-acid--[acyl-carrier-protein] ligase
MGAQSTFFGPAKYGVIPEIVEDKILIDANGIVQMTTMLAIILGQAMAGWLVDTYRESLAVAGIYCAVIALLGVGTVYLIRGTGANRPEMRLQLNPFGRIWTSLREMAADKPLFLALIGGSFFFFSGAMVTLTVNNYGVNLLGLTAGGTSMLLVRLAFGIMIGCLVTGPIQRRIGGKWTIFLGAVGVAASEFALYFYGAPRIMIHLFLFSAGFFTGLYYVPIATFMQSRPKLGKKGEILAAYNFSNFVSILLAGVVWQLLMTFKISAHYAWWGLTGMLILLLVFMFPHLKRID